MTRRSRSATWSTSRIRFSSEPPYSSSRRLLRGEELVEQIAVASGSRGCGSQRSRSECRGLEGVNHGRDPRLVERGGRTVPLLERDRAGGDRRPAPLFERELPTPLPGDVAAPLRPEWASWIPATAPCEWMKRAILASGSTWASSQIPMSPGEIRPSRVTAVASTKTSAAPPDARLPRWTRCQSLARPSSRRTGNRRHRDPAPEPLAADHQRTQQVNLRGPRGRGRSPPDRGGRKGSSTRPARSWSCSTGVGDDSIVDRGQ